MVGAGLVVVEQGAAERALSALGARDEILLRRQQRLRATGGPGTPRALRGLGLHAQHFGRTISELAEKDPSMFSRSW